MLESYIRRKLKQKDILLMTHIVLGYPSFEDSYAIIDAMLTAGVDLMELQIPFSEPIADGPVILRTNQKALEKGVTVEACLDFIRKITGEFDIPFLVMSYYNILFKYGVERFVREMAQRKLKGSIIPDLPPEEGQSYLAAMQENELAPILIFAPTTPPERMQHIASLGRGFIYCVARKGVTGANTDFSAELTSYLDRCRKATHLPLALGFGVTDKADIDYLKGKADIAVVGSQMIRIIEEKGIASVDGFIRGLQ